jgi:hypothetical protein
MIKRTLTVLALLTPFAVAADMAGQSHPFTSPNGVIEQCVRADKIPGGVFSEKDDKSETDLCSYDIYRQEVAMCPKTWSTSPGTILYSTEGTNLTQAQFEARRCTLEGKDQNTELSQFKNSMNQAGTSGTLSQSSLLYYQLSRYFDVSVQVPVAVYRSFDKEEHLRRVSLKARGGGAMNRAGWTWEVNSEKNPNVYQPTRDLFTPDLKQIYGVLLGYDGGIRYGAEVNGIRSPGLIPQSKDFLSTPGFLALRSEQPYATAVQAGIAGSPLPPKQIGLWMKDLCEITLLDTILSQQDRIGNIDYYWAWAYHDAKGSHLAKETRPEFKDLARDRIRAIAPPAEIASLNPFLVQRSIINDNDAGGRPEYANLTAKVRMLEKIRHYDLQLYRKLLSLNADLQRKGAVFAYLRDTMNITNAQLGMIVRNTAAAAAILQDTCRAGKLRFDLNEDRIITSTVAEEKVGDCAKP